MSKTPNKSKSELEYLRGEVRRLKKINRSLKRENKGLNNRAHFYEDSIFEVAEEISIYSDMCKECERGTITIHDLKHIIIRSCNICDFKERIPQKGK